MRLAYEIDVRLPPLSSVPSVKQLASTRYDEIEWEDNKWIVRAACIAYLWIEQ